ncbi:MAG: hypothetical protein GXO73_05200 [Calditrichaeota bacterium]|nr:hypothetical protein [Calditrichota bacterium]
MGRVRMISKVLAVGVVGALLTAGCAGKRATKVGAESADLRNLKKQVQEAPQNTELRLKLVLAYLEADSNSAALREAERVYKSDSTSSVAQAFLGVCQLKNGQEKSGLEHVVAALSDPNLPAERVAQLGSLLGHPFHIEAIATGRASAAFPYPSPDGNKLAFQSVENGTWDIYVLDLNTGEKRRLTTSDDAEENPAFSPNGKVIAYTKARTASAEVGQLGQRDIYLVAVDGGSQVAAVVDSADDWYPRFSHDGKSLFFVSERDDRRAVPPSEKLSDIYLLNLAKKTVTRLTNNDYDDNAPAPYRQDRMLLYTANKGGHYDLFVMDVRKMESRPVLTAAEAGLDDIGSPGVTQDGSKITFVGTRDGNYDIYLLKQGSAIPQRLTRAPAVDHAPVFDGSGERIFFHSNRTGNFAIYVIDLRQKVGREELLSVLQEELASVKEGGVIEKFREAGRRYVGG